MRPIAIDTTQVAPAEQFDLWRSVISSEVEPLDAAGGGVDGFAGRLRRAAVGGVKVCEVTSEVHLVRRTPKLIAQACADVLKLEVQVAGRSVVEQAGRQVVLAPGEFLLCDSRRPYRVRVNDQFRMLVVMFPSGALGLPPKLLEDLTAVRLGRGAEIRTLAGYLTDLLDDPDPARTERLTSHTLALVAATLADRLGLRLDDRRKVRQVLMVRILHHIEQNLADPRLTPERIAAGSFISTRYLHKLFESEDATVSGWIRDRRLDRVRASLRDPLQAGRPIGSIAADAGFCDAAHFSRVFKAAVGLTPREYRLSGGAGLRCGDSARVS